MAEKLTTWSPDTCGCRIEYQWDDEIDATSRTHTFTQTFKTCPAHLSLRGVDLYDALVDENTRKNITLTVAQGVKVDIVVEDYSFSFDAGRELLARFAGITDQQRTDIHDACELQFGPGKVTVSALPARSL
jgi:hypothetical protein